MKDQKIKLISYERWLDFNEYEGAVHALYHEQALNFHLMVYSEADWRQLEDTEYLEGEIWLERSEGVPIDADFEKPFVTCIAGVNYLVGGEIVSIAGEILEVQSVFPITIDMDLPGGANESAIENQFRLGQMIVFSGTLKLLLND